MEKQTHTSSLFSLEGKVALVTGATGKLGREMTFALAEMGAEMVIVSRTQAALDVLKSELEQSTGCKVLAVATDVCHGEGIHHLFEQVHTSLGRLDVLVNNVTGNIQSPVESLDEATWDGTLHSIVSGMFLCCREAGKIMVLQESGSIINISSIYGMVAADQRLYGNSGFNSSVVYGAGKAAVIQLTRYLAAYWGQTGLRVNAITPGGVEDAANDHPEFRSNYASRTPMQRMMQREEIRGAVVYLASQASSYVTGHNLVLDGGFTIV